MSLNRFIDDISTRSIEFNLGFVNKVFLNNTDKQDEEIQSSQIVELKPFNTILPTVNRKVKARPLFRGISDSITRGDIVLFTLISKKFYYMGPLNTFNSPNYSYSNFYTNKLESRGFDIKQNVDERTGYGINYPLSKIKKLSKRKNETLDLLGDDKTSKHSDLVLEGRHGNGIRIGSRSIFPILNLSNGNINSEEGLGGGSIISMIANGSLEDNFSLSNGFRLSSDILTDDDNPLFKLNLGNDDVENIFNYNYGNLDDTTTFNQIIISSDKITFDARSRQGDFTVSSNRNINFGAKKNFTLNNQGNTIINSGNIYLGVPAKTKAEPMVLGDKLRQLLLDFAQILQDSRALVQGVPIPLTDQNSQPMFQRIQDLITELQPRTESDNDDGSKTITNDGPQFMSHHHYIEINNREQNNEG